jgi:hypothetical protein
MIYYKHMHSKELYSLSSRNNINVYSKQINMDASHCFQIINFNQAAAL